MAIASESKHETPPHCSGDTTPSRSVHDASTSTTDTVAPTTSSNPSLMGVISYGGFERTDESICGVLGGNPDSSVTGKGRSSSEVDDERDAIDLTCEEEIDYTESYVDETRVISQLNREDQMEAVAVTLNSTSDDMLGHEGTSALEKQKAIVKPGGQSLKTSSNDDELNEGLSAAPFYDYNSEAIGSIGTPCPKDDEDGEEKNNLSPDPKSSKRRIPAAPNAYHIFKQREFKRIMKDDPEISFAEQNDKVRKRWHSLSISEKSEFESAVKREHNAWKKQYSKEFNGLPSKTEGAGQEYSLYSGPFLHGPMMPSASSLEKKAGMLDRRTLALLLQQLRSWSPDEALDEDEMTNLPSKMASSLSTWVKKEARGKRYSGKNHGDGGRHSFPSSESEGDVSANEERYGAEENRYWNSYFDSDFDKELFNLILKGAKAATRFYGGSSTKREDNPQCEADFEAKEEKKSICDHNLDRKENKAKERTQVGLNVDKSSSTERVRLKTAKTSAPNQNPLDNGTLHLLRISLNLCEDSTQENSSVVCGMRRSRRHRNRPQRHDQIYHHRTRMQKEEAMSRQMRVLPNSSAVDDSDNFCFDEIDVLLRAALEIESTLDDEEVSLSTVVSAEITDEKAEAEVRESERPSKRRRKGQEDGFEDCCECINCLDKPRFGGPNLRRKGCANRVRKGTRDQRQKHQIGGDQPSQSLSRVPSQAPPI